MRFKNQTQPDSQDNYMESVPYSSVPNCGSYNRMPVTPAMQQGFQMPAVPMTNGQLLQGTTTPTGYPTGPTPIPLLPSMTGTPAIPVGEQPPVTIQSPLYTPGFLKTQIGKRMRVEFLIGTNLLTDRTGTLLGVGASYILLQPVDSDDVIMCDIYSIKFVTIIL